MYENSCLKIFKALTLGLFLIKIKNISNASINKQADTGSSCRAPLSNMKYFVVFPPLMMQDSWLFKTVLIQLTKPIPIQITEEFVIRSSD